MTIDVGTDTFSTEGRDLLNRAPFGKRLSELMERDIQPLVVALDGAWGAGKSHFLQLWTGTHNQTTEHKARVIYFDAFAQDYLDDPLISLVAAISAAHTIGQGKSEKALAMVKACGLKLVRPAARAGLFVASAGISELALPVLDRLADKFIEEASDEAKAAIDNLWKHEEGRIAAVTRFRNALTALATEKRLILVIDELDRCRPDYALSLLEVVKHFFAVPGVRFVLGVNMEALEHSVRQRYGAGVDAGLYLQKFMHLRVGLPGHEHETGAAHWGEHFRRSAAGARIGTELFYLANDLLTCAALGRDITLRDVERIADRLALLPPRVVRENDSLSITVTSAVILEVLAKDLYRKLRSGTATSDDMCKFFSLSKEQSADLFRNPYLQKRAKRVWDHTLSANVSDAVDTMAIIAGRGERPAEILEKLRDILDSFAPPPAR